VAWGVRDGGCCEVEGRTAIDVADIRSKARAMIALKVKYKRLTGELYPKALPQEWSN